MARLLPDLAAGYGSDADPAEDLACLLASQAGPLERSRAPLNARVAERCGFTREEVLPADATHDWRTVELVAFSLLARDLP